MFLDVSAPVGTTHQNAEEVTENVRTVHVRAHRHQLAHQVLHEQVDDCAQLLQRILVGTLLQCVLRFFQRFREILVRLLQRRLHHMGSIRLDKHVNGEI